MYAVLLIGVGRRRASASPPALLSGSAWSWSSFGSSSAQTKYTAIIDLQSYLFAMLGLICANGWVQYHEYAFLVRVSSGGISALKGKTHSEALKLALCSINHKSTKQQLDLSKPNFVFELTMPFLRKHLDHFTYWRGGFSKSWCVLLCNCRCIWQDWLFLRPKHVSVWCWRVCCKSRIRSFFSNVFLIYMADFRFLKPLLFIAKWAKRVSFLGLLKKIALHYSISLQMLNNQMRLPTFVVSKGKSLRPCYSG